MKDHKLTKAPTLLSECLAFRLSGVVFAFFLLLVTHTSAQADSPAEHPAVELSFITIDVAPWAYRDEQTGAKSGAFMDIVQALEQETGYRIHTTLTPFARVDRELESGDHDCTILVPRSEKIVKHGSLITDHDIGVVSRADNPIASYADLKDQRISVLRGSSISEQFDQDDAFEREYDTDYAIALRKLDRERVDGIAGAIPTLLYLAEKEGLVNRLASPLKLSDIPLIFQCSLNSPYLELMPDISAAIEILRSSGQLQSIVEKYRF